MAAKEAWKQKAGEETGTQLAASPFPSPARDIS